MVHTSLRTDRVSKVSDCGNLASQQDGLKAVLMVQVRVHRRNRQVVMIVLQTGQPFRQLPLTVVEHIGKAGHAMLRRSRLQASLAKLGTQQIANRFRAVAVAALGDPAIELLGQPIIKGNGEALHGGGAIT